MKTFFIVRLDASRRSLSSILLILLSKVRDINRDVFIGTNKISETHLINVGHLNESSVELQTKVLANIDKIGDTFQRFMFFCVTS